MNTSPALAVVSERITPRVPQVVDELTALLLSEIEVLHGDEFIQERLYASIESNISTLLHLMRNPVDLALVEPPPGAVQWAQRAAQRGVPFSAVWRAYHVANASFFDTCLRVLERTVPDAADLAQRTSELSTLLHAYVDHTCQRIGATYDTERERWLRQQDTVRAERVRELLDGRVSGLADVEAALGYYLAENHLGMITWTESVAGNELLHLQQVVADIADRLRCAAPPLVLPRDATTVWAWLPLPAKRPAAVGGVVEEVLRTTSTGIRVASGDPATSVDGFARTHRQAATAQSIAVAAGASGALHTPYREVASISFLYQDLDRAREWIHETLAGLATDDEHHARSRVSLSAFLTSGGSFTAAAERLGCHKNTIQYRIRKAEQELGFDVRSRRIDLELALHACEWLGQAVLQRP